MPSARSVTSRIVCPAPVASAVCRSSSTSVHSAGDAAVVEDGLADELDLDAAVDALDRPDEHVVGVVVGGRPRVRRDRVLVVPRPDRERVADDDPARRGLPRRHEDVRARLVRTGRRMVDRRTDRSGRRPPPGRARSRTRSASRTTGRRASRPSRRARRARRCGSPTGTRSPRSAGTATERRRSAAAPPLS